MSDRDNLYRAILTNPADDAPRLVYADWLEERGDLERAELIRHMIHFPRDRASYRPPRPASLYWPDAPAWVRYAVRRGFVADIQCETGRLLDHAGELFARHPITGIQLLDRSVGIEGPTGVRALLVPAALLEAGHFWPLELFPDAPEGTMLTYPSAAKAFGALSKAAVAFGRRAAGLPPLE